MNHKITITYLTILLLIGVSLSQASPSHAQETGFTETFDDPSLPGWEHSPNATVVNGVLRIEPGGFAFHGGNWNDQTLSVMVRLTGTGATLIKYRATDQSAYIIRFAGSSIVLQRDSSGTITDLGSANLEIPLGESARIVITASGGQQQIVVNGNAKIIATDSVPLSAGGLFLFAEGTAVEFDELTLTASGGAAPTQVVAPTTVSTVPPTSAASAATSVPSSGVPAYQAGSWVRTGGPIGGLGYDIRVNFNDHNTWYVTDAFSGFYISTDDGNTWTPSNDGITSKALIDGVPAFSATVDPHNPDIIWVGMQATSGIYKSMDGGKTWVQMTNGIDVNLNPISFRGFTVDPRTSDIVYAMGEIGSIGWTPDGSQRRGLECDLTQGIVYKTTDGGQNWKQIWRGDNLARYMWIDPSNPDVLYVSTGIFDREAANSDATQGIAGGVGILKSTDGGQTWRVLNEANGLSSLYIGSLFMKSDNPDVLLAAAGQNNWSTFQGHDTAGNHLAGVYLTEDGGEHWTSVLSGELFTVVEYCTSDPEVAYAASSRAVYRSDDGGHTWQKFTRANNTWGPPGIVAGFPIDFQCDPDDPMRVFDNNYLGGNFLSEDGGQTWTLTSKGYTGEMTRQIAIASGRPQIVFAGGRSGIYRSDNGGDDWVGLVNPPAEMIAKMNDGAAMAVDPSNADHILYVAKDLAAILSSYDGGQTWSIGQAIAPNRILFAPSDPTTVYAGVYPWECVDGAFSSEHPACTSQSNGLYISNDGGQTWAAAPSQQVSGGVQINALVVHPRDAQTVYVATKDGAMLKSTDGGQNWVELNSGLPTLPVSTFAIAPSNPDILFTAMKGTENIAGGGLYRSTDGGTTWTQLNSGLAPEAPITSILVDPTNSQIVYLGDFFSGIYVSTDGGGTWQSHNQGLTHTAVKTMEISDDGTVLYASIWGDGVYRLGTVPVSSGSTPTSTTVAPPGAASPTPQPSGSGGPCSGVIAIPLGLLFLAQWRRKSRK